VRLVADDHVGDRAVRDADGHRAVGAQLRAHHADALHDAHDDAAAAGRLELHAVAHHERPRQVLRRPRYAFKTRRPGSASEGMPRRSPPGSARELPGRTPRCPVFGQDALLPRASANSRGHAAGRCAGRARTHAAGRGRRGRARISPEMAFEVSDCAPQPMATPLTPPTASSGWMLSPNACSLPPRARRRASPPPGDRDAGAHG